MLNKTINEHKNHVKERNKKIQQQEKKVIYEIQDVLKNPLSNMSNDLNSIYNNQIEIEEQTKLLREDALHFNRETKKWLNIYKELNDNILQLGHIENWSNIIDQDLQFIASVLDNVVTSTKKKNDK